MHGRPIDARARRYIPPATPLHGNHAVEEWAAGDGKVRARVRHRIAAAAGDRGRDGVLHQGSRQPQLHAVGGLPAHRVAGAGSGRAALREAAARRTAESGRSRPVPARRGRARPPVACGAGVGRTAPGARGLLHVGAFSTANIALVPAALRAFRQARPDVEVIAVEGRSGTLTARLADGALDLAVVSDYPSGLPAADGVATTPLCEDELLVALPASIAWPRPA